MDMYEPMLATPFKGLDVRPYLNDARCSFQQKFDGNRLLGVWRPMAGVQYLTRGGSVYSKRVPAGLRSLSRPTWNDTATVILDGELVDTTWHVFDFLVVGYGDQQDRTPYAERRQRLVERFAEYEDVRNMRLVPETNHTESKALFLEQAIKRGAEGVVMKQADSAYWFGRRSKGWLKVKFERTAEVIILSVRTKGKESAVMAMRDGNRVVEVGDVSLLGKEKQRAIVPGMVVEVKYLYATDDHRLYQPRIIRLREDKTPAECTVDQLVYTDKGALVR